MIKYLLYYVVLFVNNYIYIYIYNYFKVAPYSLGGRQSKIESRDNSVHVYTILLISGVWRVGISVVRIFVFEVRDF